VPPSPGTELSEDGNELDASTAALIGQPERGFFAILRVHAFTLSLDGFGPFGDGAEHLHDWMFATRPMQAMMGKEGGTEGPDDEEVRAGEENVSATIMGRNMFGTVRGPWPDESSRTPPRPSWPARSRPPADATSGSGAARRQCGSSWPPGWSTTCTW